MLKPLFAISLKQVHVDILNVRLLYSFKSELVCLLQLFPGSIATLLIMTLIVTPGGLYFPSVISSMNSSTISHI
jgi:hypothetical protein